MDHVWERSIPFYEMDIKEASAIFTEYDRQVELSDLQPIYVGCRNSNYKVRTGRGTFLLRICPLNDTSYRKEQVLWEGLNEFVKLPQLLFVSRSNATPRVCLIYEYIDAISMQEIMARGDRLADSVLIQVAESAAYIHNSDMVNAGTFRTLEDYPPFFTWYGLFLEQEAVVERLGGDVAGRVKKLISDKEKELSEIERYISFIHSDFRPANMLIDKQNDVWIVDWEGAGFGHSLADIGQFFRYSDCFDAAQRNTFAATYNRTAKRALPSGWYSLCKLRDLVNPLQMLGGKAQLPQMYDDLKKVIADTLGFFGY